MGYVMNQNTISTGEAIEDIVRITIDVPRKIATILELEAAENKRSRKAQLELTVEKHAERYARRDMPIN